MSILYHSLTILLLCWYAINSLVLGIEIDCPDESDSIPHYFHVNIPIGCKSSSSCILNISIGPNQHNSSFVDFHIEAKAGGYGAVGFSKEKRMPGADVIGCGHDGKGVLYVRNTWNKEYLNRGDPIQDGVCKHNIAFENGLITCSFSRYAGVINPGRDYDLNETYYLLLAYRLEPQSATDHFSYHTVIPSITSELLNVYVDNGDYVGISSEGEWRHRLIVAHGILMVIAWPLLGVIGIFFSTWTKSAFPNGSWFQIHRFLMLSSMFVGVVGVILVFVANKDNDPPGLIELTSCNRKVVHLAIGIYVTVLQILNPLIAIFRCKPDSERRYIFTIIHGLGIGHVTQLLALVNVGLGIALIQVNCEDIDLLSQNGYILFIYIIWLIFFVVFNSILFVVLSLSSLFNIDTNLAPAVLKPFLKLLINQKKTKTDESNELLGVDEPEQEQPYTEEPGKTKDKHCRRVSMVIFVTVTAVSAVILMTCIIISHSNTNTNNNNNDNHHHHHHHHHHHNFTR